MNSSGWARRFGLGLAISCIAYAVLLGILVVLQVGFTQFFLGYCFELQKRSGAVFITISIISFIALWVAGPALVLTTVCFCRNNRLRVALTVFLLCAWGVSVFTMSRKISGESSFARGVAARVANDIDVSATIAWFRSLESCEEVTSDISGAPLDFRDFVREFPPEYQDCNKGNVVFAWKGFFIEYGLVMARDEDELLGVGGAGTRVYLARDVFVFAKVR